MRPARDLKPLFDPRSVAILGASATPSKWGYWLARSALRGVGRRAVFLVNRRGQDILGQRTYRSLADLPQEVEMVVISIGSADFEQAVDDALAAGARAIVAITAGLGEIGRDGRALERAVTQRVRAAGAVLVGPNCLGVADTGSKLDLASSEFGPGSIGLISQSGNLALELALIATEAGVGFSRFVSVGNQADLDVTELIQAYAAHDQTRVIAVYAEDFQDGRDLAGAASRALDAGKPVILLTVGSSRAGARAARSHTGAMVSASVAVDAACRASGMMRVGAPRQMIELAQALLMSHSPRGRRVGIVGDGGGHVALAADMVTEGGMSLPLLTDELATRIGATLPAGAATRNPVDLAGGGEQDFMNFERTIRTLATSGEVDSVLLTGYFGGYSQESVDFARRETQVALGMADAAAESGRPLVVHTMYPASPAIRALRARRIPVYADIQSAVAVLRRLVDRSEQPPSGVPVMPAPSATPPVPESYFEARELMAAAGIPFIGARKVTTPTEAAAAALELGYPVVLKALGASHKSDRGGVQLGITDEATLKESFAEMSTRLEPPAFSVERMASTTDAIELIVGVRRDPSFGPVVVVGMGGMFADLLQDVAVALAPLTQEVAEQLIRSLRGAPLLLGARGRPSLDVAAAARTAVLLSQLATERGDIAEIELNPVLVRREGALALDARIVRKREEPVVAR
ncbi:MAG: acetate--CoA ligase family protein [Candidatus Dormibacteraeota bacterium]|nr:acetate--CoA ligase family protein [Candidatus Dormibacteraeota bacterium]